MNASIYRRIVIVFTVFVVSSASSPLSAHPQRCSRTSFTLKDLEKRVSILSPDGRHRVSLSVKDEDDENGGLRVYTGKQLIAKYALGDLSGSVYVNWAPDSQAFYFLWSNGGAIGTYKVRVFKISTNSVQEFVTIKNATMEFERHHSCAYRDTNVFVVRWMKGSDELLLAPQVYPTSDCGKEMGVCRGYRVRISDGAILQRYSEKETISIWRKSCPGYMHPSGY